MTQIGKLEWCLWNLRIPILYFCGVCKAKQKVEKCTCSKFVLLHLLYDFECIWCSLFNVWFICLLFHTGAGIIVCNSSYYSSHSICADYCHLLCSVSWLSLSSTIVLYDGIVNSWDRHNLVLPSIMEERFGSFDDPGKLPKLAFFSWCNWKTMVLKLITK